MIYLESKVLYAAPFILGAAMATNVSAAGFQLSEHSANGLGRAYAGEAATAENSSVIFRNPAAMTYFEQTALSVGTVYIEPSVDLTGTSEGFGSTDESDVANGGLLPNLSVVQPLPDNWWVGLSVGSHFNTGVEYDNDFAGSHYGDLAEITTMDINLSLAKKITPALSIGAGISAIRGEGQIRSSLPQSLGGATMLDLEGEAWAWTWNLGTMWQINESNRLAITYKHHTTLDLEGSASSDLEPANNGSGRLPLELPAMVEIASWHQLTDRMTLHLGLNWSSWSRFESLTADIEGNIVEVKEENWDDTLKASIGVTYKVNELLVLRAGFAYDQAAADHDTRTITIPDADRFWYSAGIGYQIDNHNQIDLGLTYIDFKDADIAETSDLLGDQLDAQATGHAWLAGVQYSYQF